MRWIIPHYPITLPYHMNITGNYSNKFNTFSPRDYYIFVEILLIKYSWFKHTLHLYEERASHRSNRFCHCIQNVPLKKMEMIYFTLRAFQFIVRCFCILSLLFKTNVVMWVLFIKWNSDDIIQLNWEIICKDAKCMRYWKHPIQRMGFLLNENAFSLVKETNAKIACTHTLLNVNERQLLKYM